MDKPLISRLQSIVSEPRLDRYRTPAATDLDVVTNHLWNIQLAEALLPCIAFLEVSLRNAVHSVLSSHTGTEHWFQSILHPRRWSTVEEVIAEIAGVSTAPLIVLPTPLPAAGKIISKLTFGFWPHIFSRHYQKVWWQPAAPLIAMVIPNHPNVSASTRSDLHRRLLYFNELRNRAMHHEAIFQGVSIPQHPIKAIDMVHAELLETIEWVNPDALRLLQCLNRFPAIVDPMGAAGRLAIRAAIQSEFDLD